MSSFCCTHTRYLQSWYTDHYFHETCTI
jgi:hypothetical protein